MKTNPDEISTPSPEQAQSGAKPASTDTSFPWVGVLKVIAAFGFGAVVCLPIDRQASPPRSETGEASTLPVASMATPTPTPPPETTVTAPTDNPKPHARMLRPPPQSEPVDWQARAIEKYPDLAIKGSAMNTRFVTAYRSLVEKHSDYLANPQW